MPDNRFKDVTIFYSSENQGHHQTKGFFAAVCVNETWMWGTEIIFKANTLPLSTTWVRN